VKYEVPRYIHKKRRVGLCDDVRIRRLTFLESVNLSSQNTFQMEMPINVTAMEGANQSNVTPVTLEEWKTHVAKLEVPAEPRGWLLHKDCRVFEAPAGTYYMGFLDNVMKKSARFVRYNDIEDGLYKKGELFFMVMDNDAGVFGVASADLVDTRDADQKKFHTFDKPVTIRINPNLCLVSISDGLETETFMLEDELDEESDMEA